VLPYPFAAKVPRFDPTKPDWARLPLGEILGGQLYVADFAATPHALISGTSGGGKAQTLDSCIPVPVSERFPDGWATIGEIEVGDVVFAADGSTTEVIGLSPIVSEPIYTVTFSGGQQVRCGGDHLWRVSSAASRAAHGLRARRGREARQGLLVAEEGRLRALAATVGPGKVATLPEIARISGRSDSAVRAVVSPALATQAAIPAGKPDREYLVADVEAALATRSKALVLAGPDSPPVEPSFAGLGEWATLRQLSDHLLGRPSTHAERCRLRDKIRHTNPAWRPAQALKMVDVYPVDEVLTLMANRCAEACDESGNGHEAMPLETVRSTRDMAAAVRTANVREEANWAVHVADAFDGPGVDLLIDPYVMGAWLGDGSSYSGQFTQDEATSPDWDASDRDHLARALADAGYEPGPIANHPKMIGTRGLAADLRSLGLIRNKHIPAAYLRASAAQRLALLQGLMDTDGTIDAHGSCELSLCDERLAADALELVRSLGIKASMGSGPSTITEDDPERPGKKRRRVTGTRWRIHFTTTTEVFRLPRKAARLPEAVRDTQHRLYITDITVGEPEPARCLKVAHPDHLYLTAGFIPTHNSILLQSIISGALARGWELVIVDAVKGGVDFAPFQPFVRPSGWGCETLEEAVTALDLAYKEGVRRKELVKRHQVQKWTELPAELGIKPLVVVTDEVSSFLILETVPKLAKDNPLVLEVQARNACKSMAGILLGKIARELRYVGIHLVVSSQVSQSATGVSTELRSNLGQKFLLGVNPTDGNRRLALNAADQVPRVPPYIAKDPKVGRGCGVFEREGDPPFGVMKGYFATMSSFTDWLVKRGVPTTERTRPTASEVAKSTPAQDMPEERSPRQSKGVSDGGMNVRSGSSMDEAFRATETCATCGVPIDPATGNCRCSW
jgi:hypothetical protein